MSMDALLMAVRNRLRTGLGMDYKRCGIRFNGRPPIRSGDEYIAIHAGNLRSNKTETLYEDHDIGVTISRKAQGMVPDDQTGEQMIVLKETGLMSRARQIRALLHIQYDYMNDANNIMKGLMGGQGTGLFVVPLKFASQSPILEVGPDWFGAEGGGIAGYTLALQFGGARRIQNITGQT